MRRAMLILGRVILVVGPIGLGALMLVGAAAEREIPEPREREEPAVPVRILTMQPVSFIPKAHTFGSVEPVSTWRALAQVPGEVTRLHPDLRPGRLIEKGTEIIRIDPTDYELAEAQALARLAGAEARLSEIGAREANLKASLQIERRALALSEAHLERYRTLLQRDVASEASADQAETEFLQVRARLQEIENALGLLPAQRRVQKAERAVAEAQLAEARRNIARTRIGMPFDGRIAEVAVAEGQFVANGQVMVAAEALDRAEISAQLRLEQLRTLAADSLQFDSLVDLSASEIDAVPQGLGLSAELRLDLDGRGVAWPAEIRRLSFALDPQTRTIGLVLAVDDPIRQAIPGRRPPLVKDMFVEVVVRGAERPDALILPREAVERGNNGEWSVLVADGDNRLRRRAVEIEGMFGNIALLAAGLSAGDRVVVGELPVAIEGMRLDPQEETALAQRFAPHENERSQ